MKLSLNSQAEQRAAVHSGDEMFSFCRILFAS